MLTNYDIMRIENVLLKAQKHSDEIKIRYKLEPVPVSRLEEVIYKTYIGQHHSRIAYCGDFISNSGPQSFIIQIFLEEESNALIVSSQFSENDCLYDEAIQINSKFNEDDGELDEICSVITKWLNLLNLEMDKEYTIIKSVTENI